MGSGARIQKVVQKAMAGEPVTISVLGGSGESISAYVSNMADTSICYTRVVVPR